MRRRKPALGFDTSGINAVAGDPDSVALTAVIEAGFMPRLNATNIEEIVATPDAGRRSGRRGIGKTFVDMFDSARHPSSAWGPLLALYAEGKEACDHAGGPLAH